jgi:hypothetical protein
MYVVAVYFQTGVPGEYEFSATVSSDGVTKKFGPWKQRLSQPQEKLDLPVDVRSVVEQWAKKHLSNLNVKTGFDVTFETSASLQLIKDNNGLLINGAPEDVKPFLARDTIRVAWDQGSFILSLPTENKSIGIPGDTCEIGKTYTHTAVNPVTCACPEGYQKQILSQGWGPCPQPSMSGCPSLTFKCIKQNCYDDCPWAFDAVK